MATITYKAPDGDQIIDLNENLPLTIGRGSDCELTVDATMISRHHARIENQNGTWQIVDLDSSNGTKVNGKKIENQSLGDKASIILGNEVEFIFHTNNSAQQNVEQEQINKGQSAVEDFNAYTDKTVAEKTEHEKSETGAAEEEEEIGTTEEEVALVQEMKSYTDAIRKETGKVIIGQHEVVDHVLMLLIAGGHGLLIGMPGMAKTLLVSTIAKVLDLKFRRVQFTPDLMPTDITGTEVLQTDQTTQEKSFHFIPGPLFCNLLLADEINRTPPKTQAALLEAMQEKHITVGNKTYELQLPFFVLATQNPIEQEGTYPLPEAQMDRFMFNIWVEYPDKDEEAEIFKTTSQSSSQTPEKVLSQDQILKLQDVVNKLPVSDHVIKYTTRLVRATRPEDEEAPDFIKQCVSTGAGPRAGLFLILAAKARAVLNGRIHVSCNDIRHAALPVLRHRLITNFTADSEGWQPRHIIERLLKTVEEPSEQEYLAAKHKK
mgnify:CR=1 FL=1